MGVGVILEQAGIPILVFVLCMYYGIRLLVFHDVSAVRGKDRAPLKNEGEYARRSGILILFLGAATLVMGILTFVNVYAAFVEIAVSVAAMGISWKQINDKYGE